MPRCATCGDSVALGDVIDHNVGHALGPWDINSPEPLHVTVVIDYTRESSSPFDSDSPQWSRTVHGWKGYKNGGSVYLDWDELARRWGPVSAVPKEPHP